MPGAAISPADFHHTLIVQACLLAVFLALTFLLPEQGLPDEEQHGTTGDTPSDARPAAG